MLGSGEGGLRGIGVTGSGYNKILAFEVLNVVDCILRRRSVELSAPASDSCTVAAAPSFQVSCTHANVHVVGWVENFTVTRQVFYMPVQTSIYTGTGVVNNTVYTCNHTHHGVYICNRAGAFGLSVLSDLFTTWVCIKGVFYNLHACVVGVWKWEGFPACSWLALVSVVWGYVLAGVEIGVGGLSCRFLYFCGC